MPTTVESEKLKREQYHNVDKLAARIRLHERFSTNRENLFHWIFDYVLALAPKRASVLEIGCGRGDLWKQNIKRIPSGWQIKLTDFSPGMLEDCKRHLGKEAARFSFDTVDAQAIPYPDAHFDIVVANMMLYHVPNREEAIREFRRVLKPSGKFFATTVGDAHLRELLDILRQFAPDMPEDLSSAGFTLQNGAAQLNLCFSEAQMQAFQDSLYVTELQPLLDYVASSTNLKNFDIANERNSALIDNLKEKLHREGGIAIQKQVGLFVASGQVAMARR